MTNDFDEQFDAIVKMSRIVGFGLGIGVSINEVVLRHTPWMSPMVEVAWKGMYGALMAIFAMVIISLGLVVFGLALQLVRVFLVAIGGVIGRADESMAKMWKEKEYFRFGVACLAVCAVGWVVAAGIEASTGIYLIEILESRLLNSGE